MCQSAYQIPNPLNTFQLSFVSVLFVSAIVKEERQVGPGFDSNFNTRHCIFVNLDLWPKIIELLQIFHYCNVMSIGNKTFKFLHHI